MVRNNVLLTLFFATLSVSTQAALSPFDEPAYIELQTSIIQKRAERDKALSEARQSMALPRVLSIMVDGRGAIAQVAYKTGLIRSVTVGDHLQDGARVASITQSAVNASVNGTVVQLNFFADDKEGESSEVMVPTSAPSLRLPMPNASAMPVVPAPAQ